MKAATEQPLVEADLPTSERRPRRLLLALLVVLALLVTLVLFVAALAGGYLPGVRAALAQDVLVSASAAVSAAGVALLALLALSLERRRRSRPDQVDPEGRVVSRDDATYISPRALELQVRSLEAALDEQDTRLEEVRRATLRELDDLVRADRARVGVVAQALRTSLAQQPGTSGVGRLESAIARIGVEPDFARPRLSSVPSAGTGVAFAAVRPTGVQPEPEPAHAEGVSTGSTSADPVSTGSTVSTGGDGSSGRDALTDGAEEPEVRLGESARVLPVPAPRVATPPPRARGRLRRSVKS